MRKTNSKEVKQAVRKYLLESINFVLEEREIVTDKPCTAYFQIIKEEKFYQTYRNDFDMFEDFHQGLGGFGDDVYYLSSERNHGLKCKDFLQDWLEQTNAEVDKYSNEESSKLMINLCWREFQYLMSKEQ